MEKTTYYQLNKPEAADPLRVADFNENADKIDRLLKQVDDNSVTRSAQVRSEAANALAAYKTSNDAAVAAVNTAVSTKAEQSAVDALNAAVAALNTAAAGFGNCKIASGSYTGNGKYGSNNPTKLEVGFAPKIVLMGFNNGTYCRLFLPLLNKRYDMGDIFSTESYTPTWGDTYFSIYSASAYGQMNDSGRVYSYIVIG